MSNVSGTRHAVTETASAWLRGAALGLCDAGGGYWVADPGMDVSYPPSAHEKLAAVEDESFWFRHRDKMILAMLDRCPPTGPLLDIGGGGGHVADLLIRHGWSACVLEPSHEAATRAHQRGMVTINGTFRRGLFAPGSVSAIGLFDVIEHIENDVAFLSRCHEALAPAGCLYITVPAVRLLWSSDDEFAGHYRRYNRRSLSRLLASAGFEITAMRYFFSLLVAPVFLLRTLPTWLGRRRVETAAGAVRHHRVHASIGRLAEAAFCFELGMLRLGWGAPFGASLLAVARRSATRPPSRTDDPFGCAPADKEPSS